MTQNSAFSINDKYIKREGKIILTGVQALLRIPIDQYLADKEKGLNTATFVSGYRGSPLGAIDSLLIRNKKLLDQYNIVFKPGVNEDLAATAVWGSQMAGLFPDSKFDGVKGIWYGKGPGVDRSGDALRHANFAGVGKNGGVLALVGDDPVSKSSSIPCASEIALYDAMIPVLYPGNIQEIIDFGHLGFELSRYSGLWVGYKCTTDVMDGFGTAIVRPNAPLINIPDFEYKGAPWEHVPIFFPAGPPLNVMHEAIMESGRMEAARAFIKVNNINKIKYSTTDDKIGIIAAGKTYYDMIEALRLIGVEEDQIENHGLRILKLGAIYPMEESIIHEFSKGLDKIIIVEEKRDLIENQITKIIYHSPYKPILVGKKDNNGAPLFPAHGESSPDLIANIFTKELAGVLPEEYINKRIAIIQSLENRVTEPSMPRTPFYCSGCPHNTSTLNAPEGSVVGAGIGCHGMSIIIPDSQIKGITHMGGEGAQWVGIDSFVETSHFFQHLGDGTFSHSGSLAIRQAISGNSNITYKLLFNQTVAMTGGQDVESQMGVSELTRWLEAEGVKQIIITSDEPDKYDSSLKFSPISKIWHRDKMLEAQEELREVKGVTVLIHDQGCAAELRRKRKRGLVTAPKHRAFINEEVCEGCNDCAEKSNCLSVRPTETKFGRKNIIDQSSCNLDFSCFKGDCPSFLSVIPDPNFKKSKTASYSESLDLDLDNIPNPVMRVTDEANIYLMGIGGTGVVTINQILGTAAVLDNKEVNSMDQIGLSQKGGAVISHFKISNYVLDGSNRVAKETADAILGFDILSASNAKALSHASPDKTIAIVSTDITPTGFAIRLKGLKMPKPESLIPNIEKYTVKDKNIYFDAIKISNLLFESHYHANIMIVGAAYQAGCIPISADKIEQAIALNGVKIDANVKAFRAGRKLANDPNLIQELENLADAKSGEQKNKNQAKQAVAKFDIPEELLDIVELRYANLIKYQNTAYANKYANTIQDIAKKEMTINASSTNITKAVADNLYKVMAYKDEYEVARLHTNKEAKAAVKKQFGDNAKYSILLHPPVLRAMGYKKKIKFGAMGKGMLSVMANFKFLRNTPLDIFGYAGIRKAERKLLKDYNESIENIQNNLTSGNYNDMLSLAKLPEVVIGYEDIKLNNIKTYYDKLGKV